MHFYAVGDQITMYLMILVDVDMHDGHSDKSKYTVASNAVYARGTLTHLLYYTSLGQTSWDVAQTD